jgi:DNA-directed RNA polymerase specialized sigma24 family protein
MAGLHSPQPAPRPPPPQLAQISMGGDDVWMVAAPTPEPRLLWSMVSDEELDRALGALSPVYRTPYVLHTVHGRSYGEIAKQIGIPPGTIGSRIHRARTLLRRYLVKGGEAGRQRVGAGRGRRAGVERAGGMTVPGG